MDIEVVSENENKLIDRKEIRIKVGFSGATPKRSEIKGELSGKLGMNSDLLVIRQITEKYGTKSVEADVHIYKNVEKLKEIEPKYAQKREGMGVEKKETPKEAEAPKEEPKKEEKPKEEPKAEPKKEEKPKEEPKVEKKEEPKKEEEKPEKKEEKPPEKKEEKKGE